MLKKRLNILLLSLLLLNGCVKPPPTAITSNNQRQQYLQQLQNWQAKGRMAINSAQHNVTASFIWEQNQEHYRIHFYSPFSTESLTIVGDDQQFKIEASNGESNADLELEQNLPFKQLSAWLKGLPSATSNPAQATYDAKHQLQTLHQDDWKVEYQSYQNMDPIPLPAKLTISNAETKVKILVKNWQK